MSIETRPWTGRNRGLTGLNSMIRGPMGDANALSTTSHIRSSRLLSRSSNVMKGHSPSIWVYLNEETWKS